MATLAIYPRHDANVTVTDGVFVKYFEIEKFAQKRYFGFNPDPEVFKNQVIQYILKRVEPETIDTLVFNWLDNLRLNVLRDVFPNVKRVMSVRHHLSHAWSAYMFTEAGYHDLIASIDGGGDENDYFRIYTMVNSEITELSNIPVNLGKPYRLIGLLSPELYLDRSKGYRTDLALSGKKMSLAALGRIRKEFVESVRNFYLNFMKEYDEQKDSADLNFKKLLQGLGFPNQQFLDHETARDVLATSQHVFEELLKQYLYPYIKTKQYERVIMVGGCGLNVTMNSKIVNECGVEVFVPPCPNDCGISLGAIKQVYPNIPVLKTPFSYNFPEDSSEISCARKEFYSKKIAISEVAKKLFSGEIIGTIVGPLEIGPRALGNRSYLANPFFPGMKDRINSPRIKNRECWRPVAPIVTLDSMQTYFEGNQRSDYMTFAPLVKPEFKSLLREITHVDGSARIQTVSSSDGWVYALMKEFGKLTGHEVLMNTSFNIKGNPLINSYEDAFSILRTSDLDAVLTQDEFGAFEIFYKRQKNGCE